MKNIKFAIAILLIFIIGALGGAAGNWIIVNKRIENFRREGPPPIKHFLLGKMSHELDLSSGQRTKIEKIIEQLQEKLQALRDKHSPEFIKAFEDSFDEIKKCLNDEQKLKLTQLHKELKERWDNPSPPPPPMRERDGEHPREEYAPRLELKSILTHSLSQGLGLTETQIAEVESAIDQFNEKVRETLDDEQKKKFDHLRIDMGMPMRPPGPPPPPFP